MLKLGPWSIWPRVLRKVHNPGGILENMSLVIPVAHDPTCPWCWIGLSQVRRLRQEFDVEFEWLGYELYPEGLDWSDDTPPEPLPPNKPPIPSRLQLALAAEGIKLPSAKRPRQMRIHHALESIEYMKEQQAPVQAWVETVYEAYWMRGEAVGKIEVLCNLAAQNGFPCQDMEAALGSRTYADRIVKFDDDAYAAGVYNVPTFFIGERRYAEQPYVVLQRAVAGVLGVRPLATFTAN